MPTAGGVPTGIERGARIDANTIALFTKNQRQWQAKPLTDEIIAEFKAKQRETGISPIVAHDSYLINLATPDRELREKSLDAFVEEIERCAALDIPFLVTHMGAHVGTGVEVGLAQLSESVNAAIERTEELDVVIALEVTAGQGTSLGFEFGHLTTVLEKVEKPERAATCFDTAHAFAAGYDLTTSDGYAATIDAFDAAVGLERLVCFHVNDSKTPLGSRVDRHEHIGDGHIGSETFRLLVNDARFADVPKILETPQAEKMHGENLRRLKALVETDT
jgi:deoxyribonuclease-4